MQQISLMVVDPAHGTERPYPSMAQQWREYHGELAWIFNPWTANRRDPADIGSDTFGHLIIPKSEPVFAAMCVDSAAEQPRFTMLSDGCFRDNLHGYEYTPTLNPKAPASMEKCRKLAQDCALLGGGWDLAEDPQPLINLLSFDHSEPATYPELAKDTCTDYRYWTKKPHASSPDYAWFVDFSGGCVDWGLADGYGFARGVRRVVVSPGQ